jgi:hypothetical protein
MLVRRFTVVGDFLETAGRSLVARQAERTLVLGVIRDVDLWGLE